MGNAQGNPIRNIDKRTARREYKDTFQRAILKYQLDNGIDPSVPRKDLEKRILNFGDGESGSSSNVRVVVRKRPIFEHEIDGHEFDVATCLDARNVTIHDTRMHADMRRMLLTNNSFRLVLFGRNLTQEPNFLRSKSPQRLLMRCKRIL